MHLIIQRLPAQTGGASVKFSLLLVGESGSRLWANRVAADLLEGMSGAQYGRVFSPPAHEHHADG
jgi:hypothetical protein